MTTPTEASARFSILRRRLLIGVDRPINAEAPRKSKGAFIILPHQLEPPGRHGFSGSSLCLRRVPLSQMKRRFKTYETVFHFLAIGRFGMQAVRFASRRGRL